MSNTILGDARRSGSFALVEAVERELSALIDSTLNWLILKRQEPQNAEAATAVQTDFRRRAVRLKRFLNADLVRAAKAAAIKRPRELVNGISAALDGIHLDDLDPLQGDDRSPSSWPGGRMTRSQQSFERLQGDYHHRLVDLRMRLAPEPPAPAVQRNGQAGGGSMSHPPPPPPKPQFTYDSKRRVLEANGVKIGEWKPKATAALQVLDAFQEAGWPDVCRVDGPANRSTTITSLNDGLTSACEFQFTSGTEPKTYHMLRK